MTTAVLTGGRIRRVWVAEWARGRCYRHRSREALAGRSLCAECAALLELLDRRRRG